MVKKSPCINCTEKTCLKAKCQDLIDWLKEIGLKEAK